MCVDCHTSTDKILSKMFKLDETEYISLDYFIVVT